MLRLSRNSFGRLAAGAVLLATMAPGPLLAQVDGLDIVVPANPGGGWDQTARAMEAALQANNLANGIQIANIGGAGGTIGLAQFVTGHKGKGDAIMTGGLVMLGAILTNSSPVTLDNVTPLARLTGEYEVLVVPAASPIKNLADLMAQLKSDPGAVSWGGGSAGGTDHIVAALIAKSAGVEASKVNYIAHAGGGEALSSILGGHVTVGVSGYQEFASQIQAGQLRAIGLTADEPVAGIDAPTLKSQGVDVSLVNWRGVFAPPGISAGNLKKLSEMVGKMVETQQWQDTLKERGWLGLYMPHEQFAAFIAEDTATVTETLKAVGLVK